MAINQSTDYEVRFTGREITAWGRYGIDAANAPEHEAERGGKAMRFTAAVLQQQLTMLKQTPERVKKYFGNPKVAYVAS